MIRSAGPRQDISITDGFGKFSGNRRLSFLRGLDMGSANLPPGTQDLPAPDQTTPHDDRADIDALREENAQLRELVIHLSKLVITRAVDPKSGPSQ